MEPCLMGYLFLEIDLLRFTGKLLAGANQLLNILAKDTCKYGGFK